ncbi:unnamed protein product [Sympodiomycopsis kandeliae]
MCSTVAKSSAGKFVQHKTHSLLIEADQIDHLSGPRRAYYLVRSSISFISNSFFAALPAITLSPISNIGIQQPL